MIEEGHLAPLFFMKPAKKQKAKMQQFINYGLSNIDMNPSVVATPSWLNGEGVGLFERVKKIVDDFNSGVPPKLPTSGEPDFWIGNRINFYEFGNGGIFDEEIIMGVFPGGRALTSKPHRDKFNLNFEERILPYHTSIFEGQRYGLSHLPALIAKHGKVPDWESAWRNAVKEINSRLDDLDTLLGMKPGFIECTI